MKEPHRAACLVMLMLLATACSRDADSQASTPSNSPASAPVVRPADQRSTPAEEIAVLADSARRALDAYGVDAEITVNGNSLVISRRVREYMVYQRENKEAPWGRKLVSVIGPEHDGLHFTVTLHDGRYEGGLEVRESRPDNYLLGTTVRSPYFNTYPSWTWLDLVDKHLFCSIALGQQTDIRMMQAVHRAMLDECRQRQWLTARPVHRRPPPP